jgi:DNA-binding LacI/PurR family transcriptional regulator
VANASQKGKRPTLEDLAARAGVSRALVSLVIRGAPGPSEQTRQRVLASAAELGYRPDPRAQLLARRRSRLLGVMFAAHQSFHADLLEGIYLAAEPAGYDVALSALTPSRDERRTIESLLDYRCEALVLLGPQTSESRLADLGRQLPVVVVARHVRDASVYVVRTADEEGVRQAVEHLVDLGHRKIFHVDGGRAPGATERRRGYRTTMRRHGLAEQVRIIPGGLTEESGATAAQILLNTDGSLPTAIVAFNDRCAIGLLDAFIRADIAVPSDVSIVGYDDDRLSRLSHINLTTVGQDATRLSKLAVDAAVARLDGKDVGDRETVIPPHLMIRGTTCRVSRLLIPPSRRRTSSEGTADN